MKKKDISILYVEDQDDVRLFLSKILSRHYNTVHLAENGKEGLEIYQKHQPDIIISDIRMPVMDGLSMSSRIKEKDPAAKIILTTAHSDMEYFIQSIDIGINQYILKPIDRDKLYVAIDRCVEQINLEREVEKRRQDLETSNKKLIKQERELRENLQKTIALKEIISKSEENFRQVAENIQDALWVADGDKIIYVNKAFESLFAIPSQELYKSPGIFMKKIHKEDRENFLQQLEEHEKNKSDIFQYEFRVVISPKQINHIWYRDVFIKTTQKNEPRRIVVASDISRKIQNQKLQQDLMLAQKDVNIKKQFLANVSHELRTPLNGIISMVDVMLSTNLDENQKDYALTLKRSGEELLKITDELLDIHELEQDNISTQKNRIQTTQLEATLKNQFEPTARQKGIEFKTIIGEKFPAHFFSDYKLITQLLVHLVSNALKFTPKGEVHVIFSLLKEGETLQKIMIEVRDTGIGIRKENISKIFQLFARQDESNSRDFQGLGIGLSICSRITELLDGKIEVESELGQGSSFKVFLNVERAQKQPSEFGPKSNDKKTPHLGANVLCVEDKEVNQKVIKILLENAFCQVDIAENGQVALQMFDENKHDLILMDIQMPVMDGITATKELRKKYQSLPPIIGVSANALKEDAQHYINEGLDDYIPKPLIPHKVYEKLESWLKQESKRRDVDKKSIRQESPLQKSENRNIGQPHLDEKTLDDLNEQTQNNQEILKDLFVTFISEADTLLNKIKTSYESNDHQSAKDLTHALKGLSATVGASRVYDTTSQMDALHKKEDFKKAKELFPDLTQRYQKVRAIIQERYN